MKKILFALLTSLIFVVGYVQKIGVDSKNKPVFTYYSLNTDRVAISADGNLTYTYSFPAKPISYVRVSDKSPTVTKQKFWAMTTSLKTDDDFLSYTIGGTFRPGLGLRIGRQVTIDTFVLLDARLNGIKNSVKTYGVNLLLDIDNLKVYYPEAKKPIREAPLSAGVEFYWNAVFRRKTNIKLENKLYSERASDIVRWIFAFNSSIQHTWNDDELLSYQEAEKVITNDAVYAMEEFEGRYGSLNKDVWKIRASAATPFYWRKINPIPFISYVIQTGSTPTFYTGMFTNVLNKGLAVDKFTIPSSVGFGLNWKYADSKFSKPIFYVKGEISLGLN